MPKIEIDVDQVLTCAVHLEAEPGDRLLVMNGVVIGVVGGTKPTNRVAVPALAPPPAVATDPSQRIDRAMLIYLLTHNGPMTNRQMVGQLQRNLNVTLNATRRHWIGEQVRDMASKGVLEKSGEGRFPVYRMADQPG